MDEEFDQLDDGDDDDGDDGDGDDGDGDSNDGNACLDPVSGECSLPVHGMLPDLSITSSLFKHFHQIIYTRTLDD